MVDRAQYVWSSGGLITIVVITLLFINNVGIIARLGTALTGSTISTNRHAVIEFDKCG